MEKNDNIDNPIQAMVLLAVENEHTTPYPLFGAIHKHLFFNSSNRFHLSTVVTILYLTMVKKSDSLNRLNFTPLTIIVLRHIALFPTMSQKFP
jgi:hypothetical protein